MLKPIPQEQAAENNGPQRARQNPKRGQQRGRQKTPTRKTLAPKLQQKQAEELKVEHHILHGVCVKFVHFIKETGTQTEQEIEELIHGLQKSVLSLQKQRQKIVWANQARQKKQKRK